MRYTTVIDISEYPDVYRNANIRLVYLHLALKSGWHESDRDIITTSIRRLATETGLTVAAVRNALAVLQKHQLCSPMGNCSWKITKWCLEVPAPPRAKSVRQQRAQEAEAIRQEESDRRDAAYQTRERARTRLMRQGLSSLIVAFEEFYKNDPRCEFCIRNKAAYLSHCADLKHQPVLNN